MFRYLDVAPMDPVEAFTRSPLILMIAGAGVLVAVAAAVILIVVLTKNNRK